MLTEIPHPKQNPDEPRRRWFYDSEAELDLIVWLDTRDEIIGFQLCYKKNENNERALTWKVERGFSHDQVDNGENRPGKHKASPVLVPDGSFDRRTIAERFQHAAGEAMDPRIAGFVYHKLLAYPEGI